MLDTYNIILYLCGMMKVLKANQVRAGGYSGTVELAECPIVGQSCDDTGEVTLRVAVDRRGTVVPVRLSHAEYMTLDETGVDAPVTEHEITVWGAYALAAG